MGMAERIKERRLVMDYTQEELAEKLGLQKSAIAKYENGRVENIKRSIIAQMANILDCSPAYLMGWSEEVQEQTQVTQTDKDLLHKYHYIDDKGKHTVDTVLEMEYNRCKTADDSKVVKIKTEEEKPHQIPDAAHRRTDIEVTEEMKKHDDDLMKNDDLWK
ncbi:helix-turn-helix domain-containing protein [Lacrimispora sp.]|uniref:helix-turn-helix domain-containing protein n=1 Tax=Lacrimispora sp. TaxID=2719234 RepID=UPI00345F4310